QPTPRPTTTPTTSNTRMTHDINNNHDHTQATHQPPNNHPQYSAERHSGEAGTETPGRRRGQDTRRTDPRPATTPTTSNTNEAPAINNDDDHPDDLDLGHQSHPRHRTLLWNTPSTTTTATRRQRSDHPLTAQQPAPTLWRGTLRRSRKGDARQGRGTGRGSAPKDVDTPSTWGIQAASSPNSTPYTHVRSPPCKYTHHHPQPV